MSTPRTMVLAVLGAMGVGGLLVLTLSLFSPEVEAPPPSTAPAFAPAAPTSNTDPESDGRAPAPANEPSPPWLAADTLADAPSTPAEDPAHGLREQQMTRLQASMKGIAAAALQRSADTHRNMRDALDTLEEMDDPAVTGQVDLAAVRHNLEISIRMQTLAQELQQIAAQPQSPERRQRMDARISELRQLQSRLRQDIRAPGSTLPAPAAAPAAE